MKSLKIRFIRGETHHGLYYTACRSQGRSAGAKPAANTFFVWLVSALSGRRAARGKRYELAGILAVLVIAKLAGMKSLLGASEWISYQGPLLREGLQLRWKRMPCTNTYSYILARLDSEQINASLAAWLVRQATESRKSHGGSSDKKTSSPHEHVAIDGKVLKGTGKQSYGGEEAQEHVLHVYEVQTGIVLQQCPIGEKRNEVSALKPLLTEVLCKGRILTADAAQSYHEFGRTVQRAGGDVIVIIKENTPLTWADLELFFEDPHADRSTWQSYTHSEKGHGRLESRSILTSPDLNEFLYRDWGEVGQLFRLQRERTCNSNHTLEVIYSWMSLPEKQYSPQRLLSLIRAHWAWKIDSTGDGMRRWERIAVACDTRAWQLCWQS